MDIQRFLESAASELDGSISWRRTNNIQEYAKGNLTAEFGEWVMELYIPYAVLELMGTFGALVIISTMLMSSTFIMTYRVYLSLAAIMDIFLLYVFGGNLVINVLTSHNTVYEVLLQSDISCRVYHVCIGLMTHLNVWLNVNLMIELFVMLVFPMKMNSESSKERAHFLSLLLLAVLSILNMNYFWTIKQQKEPLGIDRTEICYFDARFQLFETKIYPVIEVAVVGIIPTLTWLGLFIFTAKKFYKQGSTSPGGLLIPTREYWRISYSISTVYLLAHLPRVAWLVQRFVNYVKDSIQNPGISTLQDFHTELIDGNPLYNLPVIVAMAIKLPILAAVSSAFRKELRKLSRKICCCPSKRYSIARALNTPYKLSSMTLIQNSSSEFTLPT
ncbi:uncharacterized protein [Watersipora subatra]|uniref:uncharacterized protein n=1 Tax=Watersipora subatra TaxID=2589382 RepID=UPI00355BD55A